MNINPKTKKIIAKEIIYFFSVILFILLVWAIIETRNSFLLNNFKNYSTELSVLKIQIDSIEKTFPKNLIKLNELVPPTEKLQSLDELNANLVSKETNGKSEVIDISKAPLYEETIELPPFVYVEILNLYDYLKENDFDFSNLTGITSSAKDKFIPPKDGIVVNDYFNNPNYELFEKNIAMEFGQTKQSNIEKIYTFIKSKNKNINFKINSFALCLEGKPDLPKMASEQLSNLKQKTIYLNQKQKETQYKLYYSSSVKKTLLIWSAILFGLLYPVRGIFILLLWAFRTIKQKEIDQ